MNGVVLEDVSKKYGDTQVLFNITLGIPEGKFLTLLGPSGCGKSTTLRIIAGIEGLNSGEVRIQDCVVSRASPEFFVPPEDRELGMVFQSYAIWPHMSVFDNVAFPLRNRKTPRREVEDRVTEALHTVQLGDLGKRFPSEISGGQQQRVSLARAIVGKPRLLLMDEPLSNLDAQLREEMRFEISRLQRDLGITTIYVTHDQEEALSLSDQIAVMSEGKVLQVDTPTNLYRHPNCEEVAEFLGMKNMLFGSITRKPDGVRTDAGILPLKVPETVLEGENVLLAIRPTAFNVLSSPQRGSIEAQVERAMFVGDLVQCQVRWGSLQFRMDVNGQQEIQNGSNVLLSLKDEGYVILPKSNR